MSVEIESDDDRFLLVREASALDVNWRDTHRPWLQMAVETLIGRGAKVTPSGLRAAAARGQEEVVRMLLAVDPCLADPDAPPWTEHDPLQQAAAGGHSAVVSHLLLAGHDVDGRDNLALRTACSRGHLSTVQVLVAGSADVNMGALRFFVGYIKHEDRPLQLAARSGSVSIVRELLRAGARVHEGELDEKPLQLAASAGHVGVTRALLDAGALMVSSSLRKTGRKEVRERVPQEWSALTRAAWSGHRKIVAILLEAGADVNADRNAALLLAIRHGKHEMVRELISRGASVHPLAPNACNPLEEAAACGHINIVLELLRSGADPRSQRSSALSAAAAYGHALTVDVLVSAGSDPTARGSAALLRAVKNDQVEAVRMLISKGADPLGRSGRILKTAVAQGQVMVMVEFLVPSVMKDATARNTLIVGLAKALKRTSAATCDRRVFWY
ncbi:Ankyrin-2 [Thoreauomyces humboldtii]|nr:Ankyrin-2 [Thoreauomyces humboldtii]